MIRDYFDQFVQYLFSMVNLPLIVAVCLIIFVFGVAWFRLILRFKDNKKRIESLDEILLKEHTITKDKSNYLEVDGKRVVKEDPLHLIHQKEWEYIGFRRIPGILTGLGILGTFSGIVMGLHSFEIQQSITQTNSINNLISGMQTAFYSSIFGISSSIVFQFISAFYENNINEVIQTSVRGLQEKYVSESPTLYLRDYGQAISSQLESSKQLEESAVQLAESTKLFNEVFNPKELGEIIANALGSVIKKDLSPTFEQIADTLLELKELQSTIKSMQEVNTQLRDYILGDLEKRFKEIGKAFGQVESAMKHTEDSLEKTNNTLASTGDLMAQTGVRLQEQYTYVEEMGKLVQMQGEKFQEFVGEINKIFQKQQENLESGMVRATEESTRIMEESLNHLTDNLSSELTADFTRRKELNDHLNELIDRTIKLKASKEKIEGKHFAHLLKLQDAVQQRQDIVLKGLNEYTEGFINDLDDYRVNQDGHLSTILGYLVQAIDQMKDLTNDNPRG